MCLQIKLMPPILPNTSTNRCAAVLATAIAPPRGAVVSEALDMLVEVGAIDNLRSEQLTPLGLLIAKLPVSPRVGKLLVLGTLLGCASSVLTIAATLHSDGDPWLVQSSAVIERLSERDCGAACVLAARTSQRLRAHAPKTVPILILRFLGIER